MPRILVDPNQLRSLSNQLQRAARDLLDIKSRVGSALGGLSWQARQKTNMDGRVNQACSQSQTLATQAEEMGRYVEQVANAFAEADGQGIINISGLFPISSRPWWIKRIFPSFETFPFLDLFPDSFKDLWEIILKPISPILPFIIPAVSILPMLPLPPWFPGEGSTSIARSKPSPISPEKPMQEQPKEETEVQSEEKLYTEKEIQAKIMDNSSRLPGGESCVFWAKKRREDLGGSKLPTISSYNKDAGAYNYINIFGATEVSNTNMYDMKAGTALVWNPKQGGAHKDYGHVAIFEGYAKNGVVISDSSWSPPVRILTWDKLKGLHMIPPDAKPKL